jgi:hypothetical protein
VEHFANPTAADASAGMERSHVHTSSSATTLIVTTTMNSSSSSRQAPSLPSSASSGWESLKSYVGNVTLHVSDLVLRGIDLVAERDDQYGPRNDSNKLFLYIPTDADATSERDSEARRR